MWTFKKKPRPLTGVEQLAIHNAIIQGVKDFPIKRAEYALTRIRVKP